MLQDQEIINWITNKIVPQNEKEWGNNKIKQYFSHKKNTPQWTTKLGEGIVKSILEQKGMKVKRPTKVTINGIGYQVDWETPKALWEVKTRNYTTPGTAGEKIFGTPWKYASLPKIFNKPLFIVLVAYQEKEAIEKFKIFDSPLPPERQMFIQMMKNLNIHFIKASDLLLESPSHSFLDSYY